MTAHFDHFDSVSDAAAGSAVGSAAAAASDLQLHRVGGSSSRRLEDYYAYDEVITKQHPWYSHIMIFVLFALLLIVLGYAAREAYFRSRDCKDGGGGSGGGSDKNSYDGAGGRRRQGDGGGKVGDFDGDDYFDGSSYSSQSDGRGLRVGVVVQPQRQQQQQRYYNNPRIEMRGVEPAAAGSSSQQRQQHPGAAGQPHNGDSSNDYVDMSDYARGVPA